MPEEVSQDKFIKVRGARTHNLKNINVDIPKHSLTVITGLSGSGKSSLAFDTIYAEGQRKYVESLSAYARQFLGLMNKPDVDLIEGLSPAISIDQKSTGHSPRSTVGTVTEIYDYLRLLFARVGHPRSPVNGKRLQKQTVQEIVDRILDLRPDDGSKTRYDESFATKIMILSPIIKNRKGTYEELFSRLLTQGFVRVRVDGQVFNLEEDIKLDKFVKHNIELIIDRLIIKRDSRKDEEFVKRLTDAVELALNMGDGELYVSLLDKEDSKDLFFSEKLVDPETGKSFPEIEPHSFSFNSPFGACERCNGLGTIKEIDESTLYNKRLTIMEGGFFPWARVIEGGSSYTFSLISEVAKEHKIAMRKPIGEFSEEQLNILLHGTGDKKYKIQYKNNEGKENTWFSRFEGLIPNLERRYEETDSDFIRKEIEQYMNSKQCPECQGYRLKKEVLAVTIAGRNIVDVTSLSIGDALEWIFEISKSGFDEAQPEKKESNGEQQDKAESNREQQDRTELNQAQLYSSTKMTEDSKSIFEELFGVKPPSQEDDKLSNQELEIGKQIFKEIQTRLNFLVSVGLNYLTLSRTARTLSGGESQRIRLASQIGTGLTGVLYVLDEPSIGLHQRDNEKLIRTLENLRDIGNSVIVVEHDEDTIRMADHIVDMGPLAGEHGGQIVAEGTAEEISKSSESITGDYLSGKRKIDKVEILKEVQKIIRASSGKTKSKVNNKNSLKLTNVTHNNLKGFDLEIPLGKFVAVTGVSGSGKSSLTNEVLYKALAKEINNSKKKPGQFGEIVGIEHIDKIIDIDQSPIGRTPRSNPVTYTGIFTHIRDIFAQTQEARSRGYKPGRFSFNVKGGRCEKCQGAGVIQISMQFLPDVYVKCDVCDGQRYNRETLQIDYKGKNISQVLDMTIDEGAEFFRNVPKIYDKLKTIQDVGLGYIRLGQAATTLSGGESQRVKLSSELSKRSTGKTFYILDEPTTGLHFEDVRRLLVVLHSLVEQGNTVLVIEHNLDVIKTADHIIDLGPEGGEGGGSIVALGTPEEVANTKGSYTGKWLKKLLSSN